MTRYRLLALATLPALLAADWPQFLGPTRDGASTEAVPAWTGPPKELWRQTVGPAHSSPVVAGGAVYAFAQAGKTAADELTAFDARTGAVKWRKSYPRAKFTPPFGEGPRSTPAVAGGKVFTFGSTGVLAAWDAGTGDIAWRVDTLKEFQAKNLFFGVSASPVVADGKVVVPVGGKGAGLVAFDAATGKVAWQSTDDPASYASPVVVGAGAAAQVLTLSGTHLRAVTLAGGEPVWEVPFKDSLNESSTTPIAVGDAVVASSVTRGSVVVKPGPAGTAPATVWKAPALTCYFSTPVPVGGQLYMVVGEATLVNAAVTLKCVDAATGKVLWSKPKIGKYHAALVKTADGNLLMLDDTGRLTLVRPDPAAYTELAQSKVCGATWAHPALADGVVYVRDEKELIALRVRE